MRGRSRRGGRGEGWTCDSRAMVLWKAFGFYSEGVEKNEKILSKGVKFTDTDGCCFENRPWDDEVGGGQTKSGSCERWATN